MLATNNGRTFGDVLGDTLERAGDLLTLDFLSDRGLIGQQPAERQSQNSVTDDDISGPRAGINPAYVWGGGIALAALLGLYLVFRK